MKNRTTRAELEAGLQLYRETGQAHWEAFQRDFVPMLNEMIRSNNLEPLTEREMNFCMVAWRRSMMAARSILAEKAHLVPKKVPAALPKKN